jgi:TrmH family RNA methyltransferase
MDDQPSTAAGTSLKEKQFNPNRTVRVVLVRPRNPLNVGACARAMANFGHSELIVLDPYEPVWQETRSAPDAEEVVLKAKAVSSWKEAVADSSLVIGTSSFHQRVIEHAVLELPNVNRYLASFPACEGVTLVFGSERSGISNDELAQCQAVVRIPTELRSPSMNLGQAVSVVLYELRRNGWESDVQPCAARSGEIEPLIETLAAVGQAIDYPAGYEAAARLGRIRQAMHGAGMPPSTVRFFLSFFRRLLRKFERSARQSISCR